MGKTSRTYSGRFTKDGEAMTRSEAHVSKQRDIQSRNVTAPKARLKLHPIFENRLADLRLDGRDEKTLTRNRQSFERCQEWLVERGIAPTEVTELDLRTYFAWLRDEAGLKPSTGNTEATQIKSAYRCASEDGLIEKNPVTRRVKAPEIPAHEPEPYTHEELRKIRGAIMDDLEEAIFYAYVYGGLRRAELVELTRDRVDFTNRVLNIMGKGAKPRRVPLHPTLARVLMRYFRRHPGETVLGAGGSMRNVNHRFAKLLERAGVDGGNRPVHRIRKTASTSLRREGVHADVIDRIFGWSPLTIRQRFYSGVADDELHEAIAKLYVSDPIERPVAVAAQAASEAKSAAA